LRPPDVNAFLEGRTCRRCRSRISEGQHATEGRHEKEGIFGKIVANFRRICCAE